MGDGRGRTIWKAAVTSLEYLAALTLSASFFSLILSSVVLTFLLPCYKPF